MRIRYHPVAEAELLAEIGYLELQADGLGRQFLQEVLRAEESILEFPDAAREIRPGTRVRVLRAFRYSLLYSMEAGDPLILAVAHHQRRPGYWTTRIGD